MGSDTPQARVVRQVVCIEERPNGDRLLLIPMALSGQLLAASGYHTPKSIESD